MKTRLSRAELLALISVSLGEVLNADPPALTEQTPLTDTGLDSLSTLELLMALEVATGVTFDPDTLDISQFPTAGSLASYLDA